MLMVLVSNFCTHLHRHHQSPLVQEEYVRDNARKDALEDSFSLMGQFKRYENLKEPTSPAAETNPEMHRATSSSVKDLALAVQTRTANSAAVEMSMTSRLPNLTDSGTQTKFPNPSRRKLN